MMAKMAAGIRWWYGGEGLIGTRCELLSQFHHVFG
jgi:hypothetical protein